MKTMSNPKGVVLVTGASSGFGLVTAEHLVARGYTVFGTSRRAAFPDQVSTDRVNMIPMDVTDGASIDGALEFLSKNAGRLDVLINNAGYGIAGAIEETSEEEAFSQFDVNFFGVHRVTRRVLPRMREAQKGIIINIGSIAGQIGLPFQSFYSAAKFAIEGYTEALRNELHPFGIRVYLIVPGNFKTAFTANRAIAKEARNSDVYGEVFERCLSVIVGDEEKGADPSHIASTVEKIITRKPRRFRYVVGLLYEKALLLVKRLIPYHWGEGVLRMFYKL